MAAETGPLLDFIDAVKGQGASDEFVVALLRENGWSEKRIYQAFGAWYEVRTGRAVPNGGGRIEAAKDAFLYLLAFITLGIWAIQLGSLLFTVIDRTFRNPAFDYISATWETKTLANQLASIIVAFPLFVLVTRGIVRGVQRQPERLESSVRKWLTYIALVITASTMIADVVTFLAYFLRGDLSTRFVLKIVTVLILSGGVFGYYLDSLRREMVFSTRNRLFAFAALAAVSFGIVVGFGQIGSPAVRRVASEDARRLFDLSSLARGLHTRWMGHGQKEFMLPVRIQDLPTNNGMGGAPRLFDPVSGQPYEYVPLHGTTYRLCSNFSRPNPADTPAQWQHQAGRVCFTEDASDEVQMMPGEW